jgi:hypothetical protein
MVVIKVEDQSLDLNPGQGISWTRKSPMFLDGDLENIIESYTFPIDVPLSGRNKSILNCPAEIDSWQPLKDELRCDIYYHGVFIFSGTGYLSDASDESVKLTIVTNSLKDLKKYSLKDLDLGTHSESSLSAMLAHAKATALDPLNHDYCFFPIRNPLWFPNNPIYAVIDSTQNLWDDGQEVFKSDADNQAAMPFVRVDLIIRKLLDKIGFTLENEWQTTEELAQLYQYNNHSIYRNDEWDTAFDLRNHVPEIALNDYYKSLVTLFQLGSFPDNITKFIRLVPMKDLISADVAMDWTYAAEKAFSKNTPKTWPSKLGYSVTGSDAMAEPNTPISIEIAGTVDTLEDLDDLEDPGIYYVTNINTYYEFHPSKVNKLFKHQFNEIDLDNPDAQPFEAKMSPLYMGQWESNPYFAPEIQLNAGQDPGNRIIFYRGLRTTPESNNRPFASNNEFGINQELLEDVEHSLLWDGDLGIYKTYWEPWINFLQNRKIIKRKLYLHIKDLLNFTFDKKVRIGNMNYFVNSLQVNLSTSRSKVVEVDAELSSVIY